MTMLQAVTKCLRKYATFNGRAPRSEFWWFFLLSFLVGWPLALTWGGDGVTKLLGIFYFTLFLLVFLPLIAVFTRRMHDVGKQGWSWLLLFIPIIGWYMFIRRLTKHGDPKPNKFGDPDNGPHTPNGMRTRISKEELKTLKEAEEAENAAIAADEENAQEQSSDEVEPTQEPAGSKG